VAVNPAPVGMQADFSDVIVRERAEDVLPVIAGGVLTSQIEIVTSE